jgi:hypothetical protein
VTGVLRLEPTAVDEYIRLGKQCFEGTCSSHEIFLIEPAEPLSLTPGDNSPDPIGAFEPIG